MFRGVNSSTYLSAFFSVEKPFLFVPDIFFNIVVAVAVILTSAAVVVAAVRGKLPTLSMPYAAPTALMALVHISVVLGLFRSVPADLAMIVPGLLFGASSVMLSLVWIEFFALQRPSQIVVQIALGMLLNSVISTALGSLPPGTQGMVSALLLAAVAACIAYIRRQLPGVLRDAAAGETGRVPASENAFSPASPSARPDYKAVFLDLGNSLVAFFVLEAAIGILNSFMLADKIDFAGSGSVSTAAMMAAICVFCGVVFVVQRMPKVSTVFRIVSPILAAMLVFLPFLSETYNLFFSTMLLGSYYFVALLITYLVAEVCHHRGVSAYVVMGAAAGIARVCLLTALLAGYVAGSAGGDAVGESEDTMRFLIIIVVVIYVLSMALVFMSRDRSRKRSAADGPADAVDGSALASAPGQQEDAVDRIEHSCAAVAAQWGLTGRECEIMCYLARGRTNAHIAKTLFVSENTVRSHVRNIYAKLDVHTRQDLIDLVEEYAEDAARDTSEPVAEP